MMARLWWYSDPPSPHHLKKNVVKVGPPLTNFLDPRVSTFVILWVVLCTCTDHPGLVEKQRTIYNYVYVFVTVSSRIFSHKSPAII